MKLLFDANLSPKLVGRLADLFDSVHVFDTGLARFTSDETIWEYARTNGFIIVTADSDFLDLAKETEARRPRSSDSRTAIESGYQQFSAQAGGALSLDQKPLSGAQGACLQNAYRAATGGSGH